MTPDKPITLAVAVLGAVLCALLPKRYALLPLALSLCLYPSTLVMPPDTLGLTAQRLIAAVLLMRCCFSPDIRSSFRWGFADTTAATYFGLLFLAHLMTQPQTAIVNRGGFFLSALAPFWCVRFLIDRVDGYECGTTGHCPLRKSNVADRLSGLPTGQ